MPHMFNVQGTVLLSKSFFFSVKSITMLIWILLAFVFFVMLAGGGYFAYTKYGKKDSAGSAGSAGSTLEVTENGASVTENYRIMPKQERYIQLPEVYTCYGNEPRDYCSAYDKNDGMAYVYDVSLANITGPEYTECPGGGHDCWYTEKFDNEGTLIAFTNKQGESMLDKMADDLWSDKLNMEHQMIKEITNHMEMKDGKLITKKTFGGGEQALQIGDVVKPTVLPGSLYFLVLLVAMKKAGMEKPSRIVLNIKGARDLFNNALPRSSGPPPPQPQPGPTI
jgi:hypothetical protein